MQLILSVFILIADVFAILKIIQTSVPVEQKVVWVVIVLLLPLIGVIAWYVAGPGDKTLRLGN
ncbi:PLDc N-terminal domain-containing protein [Beggiatoa leptomitoformis]|uniref:Cardiolipin synthase N-terminal domain-containing protein n=1 Tax=Beggiatoa leptomitoformis TaxID=288004 RepID=A0A2N9YGP1_9GAMM|nr:PLDc N-terminal domain-containing protein [Beggiatoa leptomitoformis]ALG68309.1 hypothetical protein AL038_12055 [Beggiatoa leptomitoformis]AUI69376.1 hypothetical protein BLE401_12210 [Beggiatoa leptomitoformis]